MTAETNNATTIGDELDTTAPHSKPETWKMPEPVFRRTSGKLPGGFEKKYSPPGEGSGVPPSAVLAPKAAAEPKPKNPTLKIVVVVLAILAMIAFLAVFLTVIYFFFLRDALAPAPV